MEFASTPGEARAHPEKILQCEIDGQKPRCADPETREFYDDATTKGMGL